MSVVESDYLKRWIGAAITEVLTEVALKRPADPIEYVALWLYKYKANEVKKATVSFYQTVIYINICTYNYI
jgi:hypothetical protein